MFPLLFDNTVRTVEKIYYEDFTPYHHEIISSLKYNNKNLIFQDNNWSSALLGAGEEKAVYCVCDHDNKVFALEIIDERYYLNGRLIDGEYYFKKHLDNLAGIKFNQDSLIGLTFTGLIKIREYIYGYEWGRFQFNFQKKTWIDTIFTQMLQIKFMTKFKYYQSHYKDVHDRNVMFELNDKEEKGKLIFYIDSNNRLKCGKVSVKAIDVR